LLRGLPFNNFVSSEIKQNSKHKPIMLDVKYNIKSLISSIYECQKKIIINKRFIRELETEGSDTAKLRNEILELEQKISDYQKELRKKYQFSY
jgi:predicted RNase H-like nuclease (RuvC/YqgF family)